MTELMERMEGTAALAVGVPVLVLSGDEGAVERGVWVLDAPLPVWPRVPAVLTDDGRLLSLDASDRDRVVPTTPTDLGGGGFLAAVTALAASLAAQRRLVEERQRWTDELTRAAHEEADARDWCGDFDDFMERVGLDRRVRDYELSVRVTAYLTVTVEGCTSQDDAEDRLDLDMIWDELTREHVDNWEVV